MINVCMPYWAGGRNRTGDEVGLLLVHDAVPDEGGGDHHLDRGGASLAVDLRHEPLGDHGFEDAGQLHAHLLLLVRREDGNDAVDRLGRVERVERREDQMAGLGRQKRGFNRLEVAHFADEDTSDPAAARCAALVRTIVCDRHLALIDERQLIAVEELDRTSTVITCAAVSD